MIDWHHSNPLTACGVTPKLALRALTHRRHSHYPANDGITALSHHVATCKRRGEERAAIDYRLRKEPLSQEKQLSLRKREREKGETERKRERVRGKG